MNHHRAPSGAPFGPNETSIIWPRTLQAERDFFRYKQSKQVISRILINISTNRWYIVGWQHRHCSRLVTEEVSKTKRRHWLQIFRISIVLLCEGWLQCIASAMQRLFTWQNHLCQINNSILSELNLDHFKSMRIELQSQFYARWVIRVVGPNLEIPFCAQPCSGGLRVPSNAGPCCCRLTFSNKEMLLMISSFKDWFHYKKSSTEKQ